jgi:hypothetical protein
MNFCARRIGRRGTRLRLCARDGILLIADHGMIRKSAKRFSEKIMPKQEAKAR